MKRIKKKVKLISVINERRKYVFEYLLKHPCECCGEKNPVLLEFDHRNRKSKIDIISNFIYKLGYSLEQLKNEIAKCRVLCGNCHQIKSGKQLGYWKKFYKK